MQHLTSDARGEGEHRAEQRGGGGGFSRECFQFGVEEFGKVGGVLEDRLGADADFPDAFIADEALKFFILPDRHKSESCLLHLQSKQAGGEDGNRMTSFAKLTPPCDEGKHIACAAERGEDEVMVVHCSLGRIL